MLIVVLNIFQGVDCLFVKDKNTINAKLYSIQFNKENYFWRSCVFRQSATIKDVREYICSSLNISDEQLIIVDEFDCTIMKYSFKHRNETGYIENNWLDGIEYAFELSINNKREYKIFIADFDYPKDSIYKEISKMYPDVPIKIDLVDEVWVKRKDIF